MAERHTKSQNYREQRLEVKYKVKIRTADKKENCRPHLPDAVNDMDLNTSFDLITLFTFFSTC